MFSEILKIKPMLDNASMSKMVKALNSRFTSVAKKFGQALSKHGASMLKGGAIAGAFGFLAAKLMDPIKEVESVINDALSKADDTATMAKQFDTSAGKLFKLQQVGVATGLSPETLNTMLIKFQGALAEARSGKENALTNYAGEKDTVDAFFKFTQAMQTMTKDQQVLIQGQIFGEKMIGKSADFFQSDFPKLLKDIGGPNADKLNPIIERLGNLKDIQDIQTAQRNIKQLTTQGPLINSGMINKMNVAENLQMQKQTKQLTTYDILKAQSNSMTELTNKAENIIQQLAKALPIITSAINNLQQSKFARGIFGIFGSK